MVIREICEWNEVRDCTEFDGSLEFNMLTEELEEFAWAFAKTLKDKFGETETEEEFEAIREDVEKYVLSEEGKVDIKVNQADALADIIFVAVGSLYKLTGSADKTVDILDAVLAANNTKSREKNNEGKITKPADFVGPEGLIKRIINE